MADTLDCIAFTVGDTPVTVGEVLRAAEARGALRPEWELLAWKGACAAEAERLGVEVEEATIDERSNQFRYEKDLVAAEEVEAWLEARGLTPDDFQAYFIGCELLEALRDNLPAPAAPAAAGRPDWSAVAAESLLSGTFSSHADQYGRRLIVRAGSGPAGPLDLAALEAEYQAACAAVLTPAALAQQLVGARLALSRIDFEMAEFDSLDAAREALLCVREDGLSLAEVARESRFPHVRRESLAEDLPGEQREPFLWAPLGELQGPTTAGGVFRLWRVLARTEALLSDPAVRRRVEDRVLAAHFAAAGSDLLHGTLL